MPPHHSSMWSLLMILCLFITGHHGASHPCGENPLRRLVPLTRILNGVLPNGDTNAILNALRPSQPELYRQLQEGWQAYARCIGLVDTGYFKRSSPRSKLRRLDLSKMAPLTSGEDRATFERLEEGVRLLSDLIRETLYLDGDNLVGGQSGNTKD